MHITQSEYTFQLILQELCVRHYQANCLLQCRLLYYVFRLEIIDFLFWILPEIKLAFECFLTCLQT